MSDDIYQKLNEDASAQPYIDSQDAYDKNKSLYEVLTLYVRTNSVIIFGGIIGIILSIVLIADTTQCKALLQVSLPFMFTLLLLVLYCVFNLFALNPNNRKMIIGDYSSFGLGLVLTIAFFIFFLIKKDRNFDTCYLTTTQSTLMIVTLVFIIVIYGILLASTLSLKSVVE